MRNTLCGPHVFLYSIKRPWKLVQALGDSPPNREYPYLSRSGLSMDSSGLRPVHVDGISVVSDQVRSSNSPSGGHVVLPISCKSALDPEVTYRLCYRIRAFAPGLEPLVVSTCSFGTLRPHFDDGRWTEASNMMISSNPQSRLREQCPSEPSVPTHG